MALEGNIWWTRKARIQAEKRLLANEFQSQIFLLWYAFFGVAVSIFYLQKGASDSEASIADVSWVVYSVLVLCMSGFISSLSYKDRATSMKRSYESLHVIYQRLKEDGSNDNKKLMLDQYDQIMKMSENHVDYDYYRALCIEHLANTEKIDDKTGIKTGLDRRPSWFHWVSVILGCAKRYIVLIILYALPIILHFCLKALV